MGKMRREGNVVTNAINIIENALDIIDIYVSDDEECFTDNIQIELEKLKEWNKPN